MRLRRRGGEMAPWDGLERWLRGFVAFITNKRAFTEEMARQSPVVRECRAAIYAAGGPCCAAPSRREARAPTWRSTTCCGC